jgi:TRAP-type mannitol/chloroaromatic compound transport system permease small subunit
VLEAVARVRLARQLHNLQEQTGKQILAVVLVVVLITVQPQLLRHLAALESSSFVTQLTALHPLLQQATLR